LFYIVRALRSAGARVKVLCLTTGEHWERELKEHDVPVIWVGQRRSKLARLAQVIREIRRERPLIVQSQHFYTNAYALAAARITGTREVAAIRCDFVSEANGRYRAIRRAALAACRTVAANSTAAIDAAVAAGVPERKLRLLPNVVDTSMFRPSCRRSNGTIQILGVGRLTEQKRFDRFIRVIAGLRGLRYPVRATIAGAGPLRGALEQQALERGLLPDAIRFAGAVSDARELYDGSDFLLLTSDYEGTPNVLLEAMAAGLPVVATCVGGTPEIVTSGRTGFLAPPEDEAALQRAACRLACDAGLRAAMGHSAREDAVARHSMTALVPHLGSLYEAVLRQ
jgi:glycosyltransferase involved in cell wall biosynthesis